MTNDDLERDQPGLDRRSLLRRSAIIGGSLVWATPVVQALGSSPAFARVGSPPGSCEVVFEDCRCYIPGQGYTTGCIVYTSDNPDCCALAEGYAPGNLIGFLLYLLFQDPTCAGTGESFRPTDCPPA